MVLLSLFLAVIFVVRVNSSNLVQPKAHFFLFDGLSCSTCEGVMNVVSKQIPNIGSLPGGEMGKNALKLAIKGACAYYTLAILPATALCTAMTNKISSFIADDILGRTNSIQPKNNCRAMGMCPPCKTDSKKIVMVSKKPQLALPWDHHNKNQHVAMHKKFEAEQEKKRKIIGQQFNRSLTPQKKIAFLSDASCYACKSILSMVSKDVTDVRASGRNMLVSLVKQQCLNYVTGIPFSDKICQTMADKSIGKLADSIMGKGKILPGEQCRGISMCPECTGKCPDEEEIDKGKEAKDTPIPPIDDTCSEPATSAGVPCTDNYPAKCKQGQTTCSNSVYERMMRQECMFTCVCRWLPKFSDLTSYLPG